MIPQGTVINGAIVPSIRSTLIILEAWFSLISGIVCFAVFCSRPLHPKGGDGDVTAIICFTCVSAVGIGMSVFGIRNTRGYTKAVAYMALALFATVVLDLANTLMNV